MYCLSREKEVHYSTRKDLHVYSLNPLMGDTAVQYAIEACSRQLGRVAGLHHTAVIPGIVIVFVFVFNHLLDTVPIAEVDSRRYQHHVVVLSQVLHLRPLLRGIGSFQVALHRQDNTRRGAKQDGGGRKGWVGKVRPRRRRVGWINCGLQGDRGRTMGCNVFLWLCGVFDNGM